MSYDANGGSGTMASQTVAKGSSVKLQSNTFTGPDAYAKFVGWSDQPNGETVYAAGATITPNAVLEAVNAIYEAANTGAAEAEEPEATETPIASVGEVTNEGTVWATSAQGFAGPVAVQVTLDGLTIKSIKIGDDQFAETDGLGAKALDPMFQLQFVDKTLPLADGDVEAISGATITTNAVLEALNAIYEAAK